jgi:hypothetical protein
MMSRKTIWRGTPGTPGPLGRLMALAALTFALTFALAAPLALGVALGTAPTASAAGASSALCGMAKSAKSGCGPAPCKPVTPADYTLPATSPRGGVRAQLSRTGGVSGSTDTLTGSGWPAGATVELLLGSRSQGSIQVADTPFAQGRADASGHLTIAGFHTPQINECMTQNGQAPGDNQALFVAQTPDARARISLLYTFYPPPSLGSIAVSGPITAGQVITLGGSGWEPGQTVTITPAFQLWPANGYPTYDPSSFTPLPADAIKVFAQPDGTFMTGATIPQEPPETQIAFIATASGSRNGEVTVEANAGSIGPSGTSSLAVNENAAYAGGSVTVTGHNWPVNQDIQITYCRGQARAYCDPSQSETLGAAKTDSRGNFTATVRIPADAQPGPITLQASPLTSPFDYTVYTQTQPFAVLYPFDQAHPRLALALRILPYAASALALALIVLGVWLFARRRREPGLAAN